MMRVIATSVPSDALTSGLIAETRRNQPRPPLFLRKRFRECVGIQTTKPTPNRIILSVCNSLTVQIGEVARSSCDSRDDDPPIHEAANTVLNIS